MARVTIEDCLRRIPSRFELTLVASKRARQLTRGAEARLSWAEHKSTVLALREIAEGLVTTDVLKEVDLPPPAPAQPTLDPLDAHFDRDA